MRLPLRLLAALHVFLAAASPASAQWAVPILDVAEVRTCPAGPDSSPPDFEAPECETMDVGGLDPQGRVIWARATLEIGRELLDAPAPLGVFVSAKASSEVYLNGAFVGRNGAPGARREDESAGLMDVALPIPSGLLRPCENEVVLRMSSHLGALRLSRPVHRIMIGPYGSPQSHMLAYYWPALIPLGALLAGGLYFAATAAFSAEGRRASALLSVMALFAAARLFAEAARGLLAYAYPIHDLRLVAILLCSLGFGLVLAVHIVTMFETRRPWSLVIGIGGVTLLAVLLAPGFDAKSALAVLVPAAACLVAAGVWTIERKPLAARHLAALAALTGVAVFAPWWFLDIGFFLLVAAYLLFLFVEQALALAEERRGRRQEAERASRLALVLEQREAEHAESARASLKVTSAGRVEIVPLAHNADIRVAGDYVELRLASGRALLHDETLSALEAALPATFLRVHRSHIVNTAYVRRLEREESGVGRLVLTNGVEVPVSRRVMPKVRGALRDQPAPASAAQ